MIEAYSLTNGLLNTIDCSRSTIGLEIATWIDLIDPTRSQEQAIEALLGHEIPTREEMREIEASSQIYREADALVMSARVISMADLGTPELGTVTFILTPTRLITVRYSRPKPFETFVVRAEKEGERVASGAAVMIGLLEAIVDRAADILELVGSELDAVSHQVFNKHNGGSASAASADLQAVIQKIGRNGDLASRVRESMHSLTRIVTFLRADGKGRFDADLRARIDTLRRDIASLLDHDGYIATKTNFLLDATLGLISIQQNAIIKIFSVAAVIFMPPTLVASIYGMNFQNMPELQWEHGYGYAVVLMILAAVLPYLFFKRRGWL